MIIKPQKLKSLVAALCTTLFCLGASAQEGQSQSARGIDFEHPQWSIGVAAGPSWSKFTYSDLDEIEYPERNGRWNGHFALRAEMTPGQNSRLSLRPELGFSSYGVLLSKIGVGSGYTTPGLQDVTYELRAKTFDLALAVLYHFGDADANVHPYVGLAPRLGIVTSGKITKSNLYYNSTSTETSVPLNSGNMASSIFFLQPIVGISTDLRGSSSGEKIASIGIEASADLGLSNTYSKAERNGTVYDAVTGAPITVEGTRRANGLRLTAFISIPLGRHSSSASSRRSKSISTPAPHHGKNEKTDIFADDPCSSLEDIQMMMASGKDVRGKTICAIESIVKFNFNESTISPSSYAYLDRLAMTLKLTGSQIIVSGHTDNVGTEEYNKALSLKRAQAVKSYLVSKGMDANMISTRGYGSLRPLRSNDTEEGRSYNRRVEFEIVK